MRRRRAGDPVDVGGGRVAAAKRDRITVRTSRAARLHRDYPVLPGHISCVGIEVRHPRGDRLRRRRDEIGLLQHPNVVAVVTDDHLVLGHRQPRLVRLFQNRLPVPRSARVRRRRHRHRDPVVARAARTLTQGCGEKPTGTLVIQNSRVAAQMRQEQVTDVPLIQHRVRSSPRENIDLTVRDLHNARRTGGDRRVRRPDICPLITVERRQHRYPRPACHHRGSRPRPHQPACNSGHQHRHDHHAHLHTSSRPSRGGHPCRSSHGHLSTPSPATGSPA